jgi:hypothetical protein
MGYREDLDKSFDHRLSAVEDRFSDQVYEVLNVVESEFAREKKLGIRSPSEFAIYKAVVIDTVDPYKEGRVRFFSPYLHDPSLNIKKYPWAKPISVFGGFDDCGSIWPPPAGSTVMIMFNAGYTHSPYYIGTVWEGGGTLPRYRGAENEEVWNKNVNIEEYQDIHQGHRKGYLLGPGKDPNDESQVLPMWNTETYGGVDYEALRDGAISEEELKKFSYPHIYGFKTIQKHMLKLDDGDQKCNFRWKRIELMSSLGNWMIFKDDHLHEGGQWAHPSCNCAGDAQYNADCLDDDGNPTEIIDDGGPPGQRGADAPCQTFQGKCANKFFKHENECRPYKGPQTPQNNRCELPQSGIQILSLAGHSMVFDDSVHQPRFIPEWERSLFPFDMGCDDRFLGRMVFKSATGHRFEMNDEENDTEIRGNHQPYTEDQFDPWKNKINEPGGDTSSSSFGNLDEDEPPLRRPPHIRNRPARNGILLLSALGNRVELNDELLPGNEAGPNAGVTLQSGSNHTIEMIDHLNEHEAPARKEGGLPVPKAKNAFVKIRSGYGLEMIFSDTNTQQETNQQYIQITAPQKDGCVLGGHVIRLQESPDCGFIFVRAAGDYQRYTAGDEVVSVGSPEGELGPERTGNKILSVNDNYYVTIKKAYLNKAERHIFYADDYIALMAGRDCPPEDPLDPDTPCLYSVLVNRCLEPCPIFPWLFHPTEKSMSLRVFASADGPPGDCPFPNQGQF